MHSIFIRSKLMGTFFCAALVAQVSAQTPVKNTADVTAFVNEPYFCEMFVAVPRRDDGVSHAYTLGSEKALESLLRANMTWSIPQAFAFIQTECNAKFENPIAVKKAETPATSK